MKTCSSCGEVLKDTDRYCSKCGTTLQIFTNKENVRPIRPSKPPKSKKRVGLYFILLLLGIGLIIYFTKTEESESYSVASLFESPYSEEPEYLPAPLVNTDIEREEQTKILNESGESEIILSNGSGVSFENVNGNPTVRLERKNIELAAAGNNEFTGSQLILTINADADISDLNPRIKIPLSEYGKINTATLNLLRESDIRLPDGTIQKNVRTYLPVHLTETGELYTYDYLIANSFVPIKSEANVITPLQSIKKAFLNELQAQEKKYFPGLEYVASVKYALVTFQDNLNWKKRAQLIEMTPIPSAPFRRPATIEEKNRKNPIINVVVLVHGHNEMEKGGDVSNEVDEPWGFAYKKEVWNNFFKTYQEINKSQKDNDPELKNNDCTLFYEFIYPSYRPVFSPVPISSSTKHKTLGEEFREMLKKELSEKNPTVSKMIADKIPFNLFIVGHSMGGLVARAGLVALEPDADIMNNFKQLITWGTPHQGSPVVSMRYILSAGMTMLVNGYRVLPWYSLIYNVGDEAKNFAENSALNTPGELDLRWTNGGVRIKKYYDFEKLFDQNSVTEKDPTKNLISGSAFYNENLGMLNEKPISYLSKFTFLYGVTNNIGDLVLETDGYTFLKKSKRFAFNTSELSQGAALIRLFGNYDPLLSQSDGAVPVFSQAGMGLIDAPRSTSMGEITHEGFFDMSEGGTKTAATTFAIMMSASDCSCPKIQNLIFQSGVVSGKINLPSDNAISNRVESFQTRINGVEIPINYSVQADGTFAGAATANEEEGGSNKVSITVTCKDGTEIQSGEILGTVLPKVNAGVYEGVVDHKIHVENWFEFSRRAAIFDKSEITPEIEKVWKAQASQRMEFEERMAAEDGYMLNLHLEDCKDINSACGYAVTNFNQVGNKMGLITDKYLIPCISNNENENYKFECGPEGFTSTSIKRSEDAPFVETTTIKVKFQNNELVGTYNRSIDNLLMESATFTLKKIK